jgi:uncharacterized protein (TIGR00156 family)
MKAMMPRLTLAALFAAAAAFAFAVSAHAQAGGGSNPNPDPGAAQGHGGLGAALAPGEKAVTVTEAKAMADDSQVILDGRIVEPVAGSVYNWLFIDSTGEIGVEVEDGDWQGAAATPGAPVLLYGEVDRDGDTVVIDANLVRLK